MNIHICILQETSSCSSAIMQLSETIRVSIITHCSWNWLLYPLLSIRYRCPWCLDYSNSIKNFFAMPENRVWQREFGNRTGRISACWLDTKQREFQIKLELIQWHEQMHFISHIVLYMYIFTYVLYNPTVSVLNITAFMASSFHAFDKNTILLWRNQLNLGWQYCELNVNLSCRQFLQFIFIIII